MENSGSAMSISFPVCALDQRFQAFAQPVDLTGFLPDRPALTL